MADSRFDDLTRSVAKPVGRFLGVDSLWPQGGSSGPAQARRSGERRSVSPGTHRRTSTAVSVSANLARSLNSAAPAFVRGSRARSGAGRTTRTDATRTQRASVNQWISAKLAARINPFATAPERRRAAPFVELGLPQASVQTARKMLIAKGLVSRRGRPASRSPQATAPASARPAWLAWRRAGPRQLIPRRNGERRLPDNPSPVGDHGER